MLCCPPAKNRLNLVRPEFGLSKIILPGEKALESCGTLFYIAPEIFKKQDKCLDTYVNMFKDKIFDLDSDRKIEVVFQCILNTVNFQYLRLKFAKPYDEFLLSSNHIQRMPLRSEELMKAGACDLLLS